PDSETMGPTYRHGPCPTYPLPAYLPGPRSAAHLPGLPSLPGQHTRSWPGVRATSRLAAETAGKDERMAREVTLRSDAQRRSGTYRAGYGFRIAFTRGNPASTSRAAQSCAPLGPGLPVHPARTAAVSGQPQHPGAAHAGLRGHGGDLGRCAADARDAVDRLVLRQPLPPAITGLGVASGAGDILAARPRPLRPDASDGRPAPLAASGF